MEELDTGRWVDGRRPDVGRQVVGHFGGAVSESGAELVGVHRVDASQAESVVPLEFVQVPDREFQYVGFFQLTDVLAFGLQRDHHQVLELVQAPVDPGAAFSFQQRFHNLIKKLFFY